MMFPDSVKVKWHQILKALVELSSNLFSEFNNSTKQKSYRCFCILLISPHCVYWAHVLKICKLMFVHVVWSILNKCALFTLFYSNWFSYNQLTKYINKHPSLISRSHFLLNIFSKGSDKAVNDAYFLFNDKYDINKNKNINNKDLSGQSKTK